MEFSPRNSAPAPVAPRPRRKHFDWEARVVRIEWFVFTVLVAVILLIVIGWSIFANGTLGYSESNQIDASKYQAVFLNGPQTTSGSAGSLYFGHITKMTENYLVLRNVYFLTTPSTPTNQTSQSASLQLTKLGCQQLHSPTDQMVINRSQLVFWENLQDNGKVVQAIKQFIQQNPNGPNCSATSSGASGTTTQNTGTTTP